MTTLSNRTIERILQEEPDEARAQEMIDRFLRIKEDIDRYIEEHYKDE